jgi:hypothetical protein
VVGLCDHAYNKLTILTKITKQTKASQITVVINGVFFFNNNYETCTQYQIDISNKQTNKETKPKTL